MASAGWRKNAGVPVLDSVAAILRQMMPDLPMPVTMTRPAALEQQAHGLLEPFVQAFDQRQDGVGFGLQDFPGEREIDRGELGHPLEP